MKDSLTGIIPFERISIGDSEEPSIFGLCKRHP